MSTRNALLAALLMVVAAACAAPTPPIATVPATVAAPTAALAPTATLTQAELKLRVLAQYPDFFFCDPDQFPVARADEESLARERMPAIQADREAFAAIAKNLSLGGGAALNADQTMAVYRLYKRLNAVQLRADGERYAYSIRVAPGANERQGSAVEGTVNRSGVVTETSRQPAIVTCPICLPAGTRIATPNGDVPVEVLRVGMPIWTADAAGKHTASVVTMTTSTRAPSTHEVVRLQLSDGRAVTASPGHPTADKRALGTLTVGDELDGARVAAVARLPYGGGATYDLLPAGPTGAYWADGVLVGSTLR